MPAGLALTADALTPTHLAGASWAHPAFSLTADALNSHLLLGHGNRRWPQHPALELVAGTQHLCDDRLSLVGRPSFDLHDGVVPVRVERCADTRHLFEART